MRMMLFVTFPTERFNAALKEGTVNAKIKSILEATKPEAVYFGEREGGRRGAVVVVDLPNAAGLSAVSEPWYLEFDASVEPRVCMTLDDIGQTDFDDIAKRFG